MSALRKLPLPKARKLKEKKRARDRERVCLCMCVGLLVCNISSNDLKEEIKVKKETESERALE